MSSNFFFYLAAQLTQAIFSLYWDLRWDWGLFIGELPDRKFLRDEIKFTPTFYYCCIFFNTLFRFWWVLGCFTITFVNDFEVLEHLKLLAFISSMVEIIRRTFWALIRVENEFFNNFEQYRDIMVIPPIHDDDNN